MAATINTTTSESFDFLWPVDPGTPPRVISHTTPSGSNRGLFVIRAWCEIGSVDPDVPTYNGAAMTAIAAAVAEGASTDTFHVGVKAYYLPNPQTGANDLSLPSPSGSGFGDGLNESVWFIDATGVDQTTPADGGDAATAQAAAPSIAIVSASGDAVVFVVIVQGGPTLTADQTSLTAAPLQSDGNFSNVQAICRISTGVNPTFSVTSASGAGGYALLGFSIRAAATGGEGAASITLDAVTTAAAGKVALAGASSVTLASLALAAASALAQRGAASITLGTATMAGAGTVAIKGTASPALAAATLSATGVSQNRAAAAITLAPSTLAAAATLALRGAGGLTLDSATLAAAGILTAVGSGQAAITLAAATLSAAAVVPLKGTAGLVLANATLSAAGTLAAQGSGAASITLASATLAAAGVLPLRATASVTLGTMTLTAAGRVTLFGSSSLQLAACTIIAAGFSGDGLPPSSYYLYAVPGQSRTYAVPGVDRGYLVPGTDNTYRVN